METTTGTRGEFSDIISFAAAATLPRDEAVRLIQQVASALADTTGDDIDLIVTLLPTYKADGERTLSIRTTKGSSFGASMTATSEGGYSIVKETPA